MAAASDAHELQRVLAVSPLEQDAPIVQGDITALTPRALPSSQAAPAPRKARGGRPGSRPHSSFPADDSPEGSSDSLCIDPNLNVRSLALLSPLVLPLAACDQGKADLGEMETETSSESGPSESETEATSGEAEAGSESMTSGEATP